jgi:ATP-dependent Clp protease, protease subunit
LNTIVTETTEHGEIPVDVYHKLANDRILFICHEIDDHISADITATLLLKDSEDSTRKITLFINSQGGDIEAPIETVCIGAAMNEAALILASGTPGSRFATKNSIIGASQLSHDYWSRGNLTDAKKLLDLSLADNKRMMEIFAKASGKTVKQVSEDFDRQVFMTAAQAAKYGLIDKVVTFSKVK